MAGKVSGTLGSAMFEVILTDGRKLRRHANQLRSRTPAVSVQGDARTSEIDDDFDFQIPDTQLDTETSPRDTAPEPIATTPAESESPRVNDESNSPHTVSEEETVESNANLRRSNRTRNPPEYYTHADMFT